jgi:hypothetical protein
MAVLECPFCYELLEVKPPDRLHTAFSAVKPVLNSYYGDIVKKKYKCQNQNCKKSFTAFWYAPLEYFSRI